MASFISVAEAVIFSECYSTGKVTALAAQQGDHVAGFCSTLNQWDINNCYSTCTVTNKYAIKDYYAAAFCGSATIGVDVEHCYTTGKVISPGKVCAYSSTEGGYSNFWDIETTGIPERGFDDSKGKTTSEMMKRST